VTSPTQLSLRDRLFNYTKIFEKFGEEFDLRDRNKSDQDANFVDINLNLSHRHNLQRIANNPVAAVE
jgi:hypothetical protein